MQYTIHNPTTIRISRFRKEAIFQLNRSTSMFLLQDRLIDRFPYQARRTPFPKYNLSVFPKGKDHRYALSNLK